MWCMKGKELNNPLLLQQHLLYSVSFNYFMFPIFNKLAIPIDRPYYIWFHEFFVPSFILQIMFWFYNPSVSLWVRFWGDICLKHKNQNANLNSHFNWSIPLVDWSNNHQIAGLTYQLNGRHINCRVDISTPKITSFQKLHSANQCCVCFLRNEQQSIVWMWLA